VLPGERFAVPPGGAFVAGEIADRGPMERAEVEGRGQRGPGRSRRTRDAAPEGVRDEAARALNALRETRAPGP